MAAVTLLKDNAKPSEREIREGISGNLLPLHRLSAHRQRDSERRKERVIMPTSPVLPKLVGQRVKRREDPRLIQGRGTYVDDIALVGMQHLVFKRSDVAHGRIVSIDTSAAEAMEGVEAVFTGAQIAEMLAPMPIGTPFPSPEHRAVAVDTVRYAGEPVAVVVAADRYIARDAADAIVVIVRHAAGRRRPRARDDGQTGACSCRFSEQPGGGGSAERHRRATHRERSTIRRSTPRSRRPKWSSRSA